MTRTFLAAAVVALFVPTSALAQNNPFTDAAKAQLEQIKSNVIRTAESPRDLYAFKPTPEVRSPGQLLAHIADGNFGILRRRQHHEAADVWYREEHGRQRQGCDSESARRIVRVLRERMGVDGQHQKASAEPMRALPAPFLLKRAIRCN